MAKIYDYINTDLAKHEVTIEEAQKTVSFLSSSDSIAYNAQIQKLLNETINGALIDESIFKGSMEMLKKIMEIPVILQNKITRAEQKK